VTQGKNLNLSTPDGERDKNIAKNRGTEKLIVSKLSLQYERLTRNWDRTLVTRE